MSVGGFVNRAVGWLALIGAAALLGVYYLTRDRTASHASALSQLSESELSAAKRARTIGELKELRGSINTVYLQFVIADTTRESRIRSPRIESGPLAAEG